MDISIGKGPDYCMSRGQVVYSHKVLMQVFQREEKVAEHRASHRSLVMLAREVNSFGKKYIVTSFQVDLGNQSEDNSLTLINAASHTRIYLEFQFPLGLEANQAHKLIANFALFAKVTMNT